MKHFVLIAAGLLLAGCAGFRGGWESVAYLGAPLPTARTDAAGSHEAPALHVSGLALQVRIDNRLRTYDTQFFFFVLPLSFSPRDVYTSTVSPGKTRVFVTVTPREPGYVFRPEAAVLHVAGEHFTGIAGFEFGRWDDGGRRVEQGGGWEHRPLGEAYALPEVGRRYRLSIDFATPTPSPLLPDIVLDLSAALLSPAAERLPLIRFAPVRWKQGYT